MSWAEIKKAINSNISKSLDVLIEEKSNEIRNELNSVHNAVAVAGNIPFIKSIQRGTTSANFTGTRSITISSINPDKSIVILYGSIQGGYNSARLAYLSNLTNTSLVIGNIEWRASTYFSAFSWQVIEFY